MKIVVFTNAAHQRKYIDTVRSAVAGTSDVVVESVEAGLEETDDDKKGEAGGSESLLSYIRSFVKGAAALGSRAGRILAKILLSPLYLTYYAERGLRRFARRHKMTFLRPSKFLRKHPRVVAGFEKVLRALLSILRKLSPPAALGFIVRTCSKIWSFYKRQSLAYAVFSETLWRDYLAERLFSRNPDLIVLLEDNAEGLTGLVSHMARQRSIPYVVLPDYIPNPAEPARYYFDNPQHSADSLTGRVIRYFAPRWILEYDGKRLLRLPGNAVFVRWMRGQHCPQPWILNAGYAEAILLESRASVKHYEKLGFFSQKLKVIGGATEDSLHEIALRKDELRRMLDAEYGFSADKPLVICGLPPDQYTAATEGFEFRSYEELCRQWFAALEAVTDRANVLAVRHPRMKAEVFAPYLKGRVRLANRSLDGILPACDLYIACISTTIRWALALGIPVLNYDTYRYDYGDFSSAHGCLEVTSVEAFQQALETMLLPGGLDEIRSAAAADASEWGLTDGKFKERLRDTLLEVRRTYKGRTTPTHAGNYRLKKLS
ncbi:hypothetical protein SAMN05877838_2705 [Hoeflea halophila]|uniref:CDP-glycerol:poly(Glycerophosphate) glycerophosphotransferase n=1 Tax=Hoeflea halophila TaxID=714899 RepID=A0A286ICK2_9HYPH|nr:hypothetical protein [Hoeflea halophila]SOE17801.1 hypothetical protein SAMN05877838_2705 [Hoeflea halophila]